MKDWQFSYAAKNAKCQVFLYLIHTKLNVCQAQVQLEAELPLIPQLTRYVPADPPDMRPLIPHICGLTNLHTIFTKFEPLVEFWDV